MATLRCKKENCANPCYVSCEVIKKNNAPIKCLFTDKFEADFVEVNGFGDLSAVNVEILSNTVNSIASNLDELKKNLLESIINLSNVVSYIQVSIEKMSNPEKI